MNKTRQITIYGIYLAILLIMGFVPNLGFIHISFVTISLMVLPITVMTVHLGYRGAIFSVTAVGIISFLNGILLGGSAILITLGLGKGALTLIMGRILMFTLLLPALFFLKKYQASLWVQILVVVLVGLFSNKLFVSAFLAIFSFDNRSFLTLFSLLTINTAIEWPVVITVSFVFYPFLKWVKNNQLTSDDYY